MKRLSNFALGLLLALLLMTGAVIVLAKDGLLRPMSAEPMDNSFTYQGELIQDTTPVSDTCDMAFRLYDASMDGVQVGSAITTPVTVVDGLFTVPLDFGAGVFQGDARWLQIAVKCPADAVFTTFPNRQALTAAPYALFAKNAGAAESVAWSGITSMPAGFADGVDDVRDADSLSYDSVMGAGYSVQAGDVVAMFEGELIGPEGGWSMESVFKASKTLNLSADAIDDTTFIVAYRDPEQSGAGVARVGSFVNGVFTWGPKSMFYAGKTREVSVEVVNSSTGEFVIAYVDRDDNDYGKVKAGRASGLTITWGNTYPILPAPITFSTHIPEVVRLETGKFIIGLAAAAAGSDPVSGVGVIGWVNGPDIVLGSPYEFSEIPKVLDEIHLIKLSASNVVFGYAYHSAFDATTGLDFRIGEVNGSNITWEAPSGETDYSDTTGGFDLARLSNSEFAFVKGNEVMTGTVSGSSIDLGLPKQYHPTPVQNPVVFTRNQSEINIAYTDGINGYFTRGSLDGSLNWTDPVLFKDYVNTKEIMSVGDDFVIVYDDSRTGFGTVIGNTYFGRQCIGIARDAANGGEAVTVIINGISDVHSGLIPGATYYLQHDGSLSKDYSLVRVGVALSETELLLDQMW